MDHPSNGGLAVCQDAILLLRGLSERGFRWRGPGPPKVSRFLQPLKLQYTAAVEKRANHSLGEGVFAVCCASLSFFKAICSLQSWPSMAILSRSSGVSLVLQSCSAMEQDIPFCDFGDHLQKLAEPDQYYSITALRALSFFKKSSLGPCGRVAVLVLYGGGLPESSFKCAGQSGVFQSHELHGRVHAATSTQQVVLRGRVAVSSRIVAKGRLHAASSSQMAGRRERSVVLYTRLAAGGRGQVAILSQLTWRPGLAAVYSRLVAGARGQAAILPQLTWRPGLAAVYSRLGAGPAVSHMSSQLAHVETSGYRNRERAGVFSLSVPWLLIRSGWCCGVGPHIYSRAFSPYFLGMLGGGVCVRVRVRYM